MATLKAKLQEQIPGLREKYGQLLKESGDVVLSKVTIAQACGGMRGVKGLVCDTSSVDPDAGLFVRGRGIQELDDQIPEAIFYLLCTGDLPDAEALASLQAEIKARQELPGYVVDVLRAMPANSHPMTMLDTGILAMQCESKFAQGYAEGMQKSAYWEASLEDSLDLIARVTGVAAAAYRIRFGKGDPLAADPSLDWGGNYVNMLGIPDSTGEFANLMRLYLTLHCDHESGNVSANTCVTIASALSDLYYAVSGGLNGLAGPLHGLANQECLAFVLEIIKRYGGRPTDEQLIEYAWETLNAGKVIPGYGHAVLRATDPRFASFRAFGERVCPDSLQFGTVNSLYKVIPGVLQEHGKAKNPWPNVDAISGSLLYHFGLTETSYYTVLFGVSRVLGMCAQNIIARALGAPITRPKSVTYEMLVEAAEAA